MNTAKRVYLVMAGMLGMWLWFAPMGAEAKPGFVKGEKCSTCHVKSIPKKDDSERNAVGKCYEKTKNLDECKNKK